MSLTQIRSEIGSFKQYNRNPTNQRKTSVTFDAVSGLRPKDASVLKVDATRKKTERL